MIALRALGPVELSVDGRPAPAPLLWRKNLALLVYLARSPRRTRTRQHLMTLLWGDKPETAARHSLREAIRVLRQAGGEGLLDTPGDAVAMAGDAVRLDVAQLDACIAAGDWAGAAAVAVGDFLEGFGVPDAPDFEDWLAAERTTIRVRMVDALTRRSEELLRTSDLPGAADCARRALQLDPVAGTAARALMAALALRGDREAALAVFERLAAAQRSALGTEPDDATARLAEQVRRQRPLVRPAAAERGGESRRAPLVGREAELARLLAEWEAAAAGAARLAVLQGTAGVGKSRLAAEATTRARLAGAWTAEMRATPGDRSTPWAGVLALARGGLLEAPGVAAAPAAALAAFAARFEEWGDRFPAARRASPEAPGTALGAVVRAAAAEGPGIVRVDDAHLLDAESLETLHSLVRDCTACPVLVVITVADAAAREELDALLGRVGREVPGTVVRLGALGPDDLRMLTRWAMPAYSDTEVDRLARRIGADSAGLPLLAVELLHAVALGLDLHGAPHAWPEPSRTLDQTLPTELPETIVAAIRIGYRRLSKHAQLVVAVVSQGAGGTDTDAIRRAADLEGDRLTAALDEAEWQRWLTVDGRGYHFVARVAKEVIGRDMLTKGQRQRIRERLGLPPA